MATAVAGWIIKGIGIASQGLLAGIVKLTVGLGFSALSYALQAAAQRKQKGPGIKSETTTQGGVTPQSFVLGRYAVAGNLPCPAYASGSKKWRWRVIDLADVPTTALHGIWLDDRYIPISELMTDPAKPGWLKTQAPITGGRLARGMWVKFYDGSQTAADPELVAKFGDHEKRPWTADMIGRGVPYAIFQFKFDQKLWGSGEPKVLFVVDGIPLYDPRDGQTRFTENAAVIAWNIARGIALPDGSTYGVGISEADLPAAEWAQAMNACDAEGYKFGAEVSIATPEDGGETPLDVLDSIGLSANMQFAEVAGRLHVQVGAPALPSRFITDRDVLVSQPESLTPFIPQAEVVNALHASHPLPDQRWQVKEAPPLYNAEAEKADGERKVISLDFPNVSDPEQVQKLMKAMFADHRRQRRHSLAIPPAESVLLPLGTLAWTSAQNGYQGKLFEAGEIAIDGASLCITASLRERDPNDYSWNSATDFKPVVPGPIALPAPTPVQLAGLQAEAVTIEGEAGQQRPAIRITWSDDPDEPSPIRWEVRQAHGQVIAAGSEHGLSAPQHIISQGILADTAYQVRIQLIANVETAWTGWALVRSPDVRISAADMVDALNAKIDTAFSRHDAALEDLDAGWGRDMRDLIWSDVDWDIAIPGVDTLPIDAQISHERARVTDALPRLARAERDLSEVWPRLVEVDWAQFETARLVRDAGVYVDPESGLVRILGVDAAQDRIARAEVRLDGVEAKISLRASVAYVDRVVSEAMLDPTAVPIVTGMEVRLTDVEQALNAETGRIDLISNTLTVSGEMVTMSAITQTLDSLDSEIQSRVAQADFDAAQLRLNAAETSIEALGDGSVIRSQVEATRRLRDASDDQAAQTVTDLWAAYQGDTLLKEDIAQAGQEIIARMDERDGAEASARLRLAAEVETNRAIADQQTRARADETSAVAEDLRALTVSVEGFEGALGGQASALNDLSAEVVQTQDGLRAEATRRDALTAGLRDSQAAQMTNAAFDVVALWNDFEAGEATRGQISVAVQEVESRVIEGELAEAKAREVLGAALDVTRSDLASERVSRATSDAALSQSIEQQRAYFLGAVGAVSAQIASEAQSRADADAALASERIALSARVDAAEGALIAEAQNRENAVSTVTADLIAERQARAAADGALAADRDALSARLSVTEAGLATEAQDRANAVTDVSADVEAERQARVSADASFAADRDALSARLSATGAGLVSEAQDREAAVTSVAADVAAERQARVDAVSALAADRDALSARLGTAEGDIAAEVQDRTNAVATVAADVVSERQARVSDISALAAEEDALAAQLATTQAEIATETQARVDADSAQAASMTSYGTRLDGAESRIEWVELSKVDAEGAVGAINARISATFGNVEAMASAASSAKATADGIAAAHVWRLNGQGVLELVSVADGTSGAQVTAKIAADYVKITGLTQIEQSVIGQLAASDAMIENLEVDRLHVRMREYVPPVAVSFYLVQDLPDATWVDVAQVAFQKVAGIPVQIMVSGQLDGVPPVGAFGMGATAEFRVMHQTRAVIENVAHSTGYKGARSAFAFIGSDNGPAGGAFVYRVQARRGSQSGGMDKTPRVIKPNVICTQY